MGKHKGDNMELKEDSQYPKRKLVEIGATWGVFVAISAAVSLVAGEGLSATIQLAIGAVGHMVGVVTGYRHAVNGLAEHAKQ